MPATRRSSRIRAGSASPVKSSIVNCRTHLGPLVENDNAPPHNLTFSDNAPSTPKTPATSTIKPSLGEMHPSKAQQSTTKSIENSIRFGGSALNADHEAPTPSKLAANSSFEFRFARPGPQLSMEAQRMMDDLREEAMRVKTRLVAEREEAARNNESDGVGIGGRKMAQPKGKAGRFSDVHMAEFKKMDSIANHPSSFRSQPLNLAPSQPTLKRKQSQAKLDEREEIALQDEARGRAIIAENDAPPKRLKNEAATNATGSVSTYIGKRPANVGQAAATPAAFSTPTKSSLARATSSIKLVSQSPSLTKSTSKASLITTPKSTQTPALARSPSKSSLVTTPRAVVKPGGIFNLDAIPRSEPRKFIRTPGKVDRLKSMLRYPSASARKPTSTSSALPVFSLSPSKPNYHKDLPSLPKTPARDGPKKPKHVAFTPETIVKNIATVQNSPSPTKSGIPRFTLGSNLVTKAATPRNYVKTSAPLEVTYPVISNHPSLTNDDRAVEYPSLSGVRPLPSPPRATKAQSQGPPSVPGTFTFRSDHTIDFGASPKGFGSSAGQASVRQVRPSIFPEMPGSFPELNKENTAPLPSVPHGLSNKKRHRADSEEALTVEDGERSPKKVKMDPTQGRFFSPRKPATPKPSAIKTVASPSKRGMTLSRLNMLARPKLRK